MDKNDLDKEFNVEVIIDGKKVCRKLVLTEIKKIDSSISKLIYECSGPYRETWYQYDTNGNCIYQKSNENEDWQEYEELPPNPLDVKKINNKRIFMEEIFDSEWLEQNSERDSENRVIHIDKHQADEWIDYYPNGSVKEARLEWKDKSHICIYKFDLFGRVIFISEKLSIGEGSLEENLYEYDAEGKLIKETWNETIGDEIIYKDEVINYEYDLDRNLLNKRSKSREYEFYTYEKSGNIETRYTWFSFK